MSQTEELHNKIQEVQAEKPKLKPPSLHKVLLMNDDYTPTDFVVTVVEKFFGKGTAEATQIMIQVHTRGKAVCGVYTFDVAETKASQVSEYARSHGHPLMCQLEEA